MKIMLIRHGETAWNNEERVQGWSDIELNDVGIKQAQNFCVTELIDNWDVVISSDLMRAKCTAEIIANYLNIKLILSDRLRERNYGVLEGKKNCEIVKQNFMNIPNGESYKSFFIRVMEFFDDLLNNNSYNKVIIVTHGGVLQIAAKYFSFEKKWENMAYIILESIKNETYYRRIV